MWGREIIPFFFSIWYESTHHNQHPQHVKSLPQLSLLGFARKDSGHLSVQRALDKSVVITAIIHIAQSLFNVFETLNRSGVREVSLGSFVNLVVNISSNRRLV
jgi:hypothetical protein